MKETIQKILNLAVWAPSGDNSQPWKFQVSENVINIFCLPEKDNPIFNYRLRGTYIANGALIENIAMAASAEGLEARVTIFPGNSAPNLIAKIELVSSNKGTDPLSQYIRGRVSNRKRYKLNKNFTSTQRNEIENEIKQFSDVKIKFVEEQEKVKEIGKAVSKNEVVMLENKALHDYFYQDVRWTTSSERKLKMGLYLKTMELAPPQVAVFKLMQFWPIAKFLTKLGLARFVAKENAKLYGNASAIGLITVPDNDLDFITAGRAMQRVWLKANQLGLSIHPVTGIVYLAQLINSDQSRHFSQEHIEIIKGAYKKILENSGVNGPVAMLFRIGYADPPSGTQSRLDPVIEFM